MAKIEEVDEKPVEEQGDDFLSNLLRPESSLDPTFLLIVDGAFATLLSIFLGLLYLTQGNGHLFVLLFITIGFWASVKWFVNEVKRAKAQQPEEESPESRKTQ